MLKKALIYCTISFVLIVALSIYFTLPIAINAITPSPSGSSRVNDLAAFSTYVYTIITFAMLLIVFFAGIIAVIQVLENGRNRKMSVLLEMWRYYATVEISHALYIVRNISAEKINADRQLNNQRRIVSHFWNMVAWAVKEKVVDIEFVIAGFGDAINIYEKLRDIEISIRKEREKQNYPDLGDQQIEQLAKYRIDEEWPVSWLYREWKKREQEKNLLARFALPEPP
jgi:hypothetical protein